MLDQEGRLPMLGGGTFFVQDIQFVICIYCLSHHQLSMILEKLLLHYQPCTSYATLQCNGIKVLLGNFANYLLQGFTKCAFSKVYFPQMLGLVVLGSQGQAKTQRDVFNVTNVNFMRWENKFAGLRLKKINEYMEFFISVFFSRNLGPLVLILCG